MRVHKVQKVQRVQRVVVAASPQIIKKGRGSAAGCVEGLCSLCSGGDSPDGLRVMDCPEGNAYKVSVTD